MAPQQVQNQLRASITIGEVMTTAPLAVRASQSIISAQDTMTEHGIRHLPVVDGDKVVGVISERDLRFASYFEKRGAVNLKVFDICTTEPYTVTSDTPLLEVLKVLLDRHIGSVIVIDDDKLSGIFTTTDAVRFCSAALVQIG